MSRQKWLLLTAAVLVGLKIIIDPLSEHMNTLREDIHLQEKRLVRAKALEDLRPEVVKLNENLDQTLNELRSQYPIVDARPEARLSVQTQIQSLAQNHNITISSLEWDVVRQGIPEQVLLTISFEGGFKDFVAYQMSLEQQARGLRVDDLTFRVDKQVLRRKNQRLGTVKGDLVMELSYLVIEDKA